MLAFQTVLYIYKIIEGFWVEGTLKITWSNPLPWAGTPLKTPSNLANQLWTSPSGYPTTRTHGSAPGDHGLAQTTQPGAEWKGRKTISWLPLL